MVGRRLTKLEITLSLPGQDDFSRGLGGAGHAAQAVVQAGGAPSIVAAHDHRPDEEVMGGAPEIFDALSAMPCPLNSEPPLGKSQIPVTPAILGPSPRHQPTFSRWHGPMIQKRRGMSRRCGHKELTAGPTRRLAGPSPQAVDAGLFLPVMS